MLLEFEYTLNFLIERQKRDFNKLKIIGNNIRKGFIGLALQNEELLNWNDQLKQQLNEVFKELNTSKQ